MFQNNSDQYLDSRPPRNYGARERMKIGRVSNLRRGLEPHGWVYQNILNPIRDRLTFAIRLRSATEPGETGLGNVFSALSRMFNPRWTESAEIT